MPDASTGMDPPRRDGEEDPRGGDSPPRFGTVASVEVHRDPRAALPAWRDLAAAADITPYQTPEWTLPWLETIGAALGVMPMIVVARDAEGVALALLPLGVQRLGRCTVACFLGAKDSNFNMGLFRPGTFWTEATLRDLLRRTAAGSGLAIDLFAFRNQPHAWGAAANPLLILPHQPSPSFAYKARLFDDPEAFLKAQLSRETRKKVRQKMNRLRGLGAVSVQQARMPGEIAEVLGAFMVQRKARNDASGIGSDDLPALRRFLDLTVGGDGPIAFYALRCGDRIVATLGGVPRGHRFSGMLTSFTAEADVARTSPGELLLVEVIGQHCRDGFATFDLGIGEARYKETYCPDVEALFDSLVPLSPRGHLVARTEGLRLNLKRAIKQSRWAWPLVGRLRRLRAALRRRGSPAEVPSGSGGPADEGSRLED